jgi:hypothetical protein
MERSSRSPKTPVALSDSVHHLLKPYALAASAAGVSLSALGGSTQAEVIYTPAHKWLPVNRYFVLDLNHDGVNDFGFRLQSFRSDSGRYFNYYLAVGAAATFSQDSENQIYSVRSQGIFQCAVALPAGKTAGPKSPIHAGQAEMFWRFRGPSSSPFSACPWRGVSKPAYLGLKFSIKGKVHYGWARLGYISDRHPVKALLTGYAYETVPNKPIITGRTKGPDVITLQPDTLGSLALGKK